MLEIARGKARDAQLSVEFVEADIREPPTTDDRRPMTDDQRRFSMVRWSVVGGRWSVPGSRKALYGCLEPPVSKATGDHLSVW